jgi:hypothetical protein
MAKFLSTTGTNYHLEELIKGASDCIDPAASAPPNIPAFV